MVFAGYHPCITAWKENFLGMKTPSPSRSQPSPEDPACCLYNVEPYIKIISHIALQKYMHDNRLPVTDGTTPGGSQQTLSAFADRLLKECKMKVKEVIDFTFRLQLLFVFYLHLIVGSVDRFFVASFRHCFRNTIVAIPFVGVFLFYLLFFSRQNGWLF